MCSCAMNTSSYIVFKNTCYYFGDYQDDRNSCDGIFVLPCDESAAPQVAEWRTRSGGCEDRA